MDVASHGNAAERRTGAPRAYVHRSGLEEFLRLRRERSIRRRARDAGDPPAEGVDRPLRSVSAVEAAAASERPPRGYAGRNSCWVGYAVEPGVPNWPSDPWTSYVPRGPAAPPASEGGSPDLPRLLSSAVARGHAVHLRRLLLHGGYALSDVPSDLIRRAMWSDYPAIVKVMLEFGVDPNGGAVEEGEGRSAPYLHRAAHRGDVEVLRLLLRHGADVDLLDRNGRTALFPACGTPFRELGPDAERTHPALILLSAGASAAAVDRFGETPLHRACASADGTAMRALVLGGGDPTVRSEGTGRLCYEVAPRSEGNRVLGQLDAALEAAGRREELLVMLARGKARTFVDRVVAGFDGVCAECRRRVSVCEENRRSRFAYWVYCHGRQRKKR